MLGCEPGIPDDVLGMLGELEELGDELGMLGDELGELEELGMLGILDDDEEELEVDEHPATKTAHMPIRIGRHCLIIIFTVDNMFIIFNLILTRSGLSQKR